MSVVQVSFFPLLLLLRVMKLRMGPELVKVQGMQRRLRRLERMKEATLELAMGRKIKAEMKAMTMIEGDWHSLAYIATVVLHKPLSFGRQQDFQARLHQGLAQCIKTTIHSGYDREAIYLTNQGCFRFCTFLEP